MVAKKADKPGMTKVSLYLDKPVVSRLEWLAKMAHTNTDVVAGVLTALFVMREDQTARIRELQEHVDELEDLLETAMSQRRLEKTNTVKAQRARKAGK